MSRVLVAVDGSTRAAEALRWAVSFVDPADIDVLHVFTVPVVVPVAPVSRAELYPNGERVVRQVAVGYAASTLLERAALADVLVVGSRGLGGFERLLLGSVSHHCASHAPCPVVIVPDPHRE